MLRPISFRRSFPVFLILIVLGIFAAFFFRFQHKSAENELYSQLIVESSSQSDEAAVQPASAPPVSAVADEAAPMQFNKPEVPPQPIALPQTVLPRKPQKKTVSPVPSLAARKPLKKLRIPNDPPIIYPMDSRRAGEQGKVLLDITLTAGGLVQAVRVSRSCGYPRLDQAAAEGVKRWVFDPPAASERHLFLPVTFRLNHTQTGNNHAD